MSRLLLLVHITAVVVFLGNLLITFYWKVMANKTKDPHVIAFSQRIVSKTDKVFTVFSASIIAYSGYAYAYKMGVNVVEEPWLLLGQIGFYGSALIWVLLLRPIQSKQTKMVDIFENSKSIPDEYWALSRRWNFIGTVATIMPLASLVFMVLKPSL